MRRLPACLLALLCACSPGEPRRELAAYELHIGPGEYDDLRRILRNYAAAEGLTVHPVSEPRTDTIQVGRRLYVPAAVILRRPDHPADMEVSASASLEDPGRVRLVIVSGGEQDLSPDARDRLFTALARQWPDRLAEPILADGKTPRPSP